MVSKIIFVILGFCSPLIKAEEYLECFNKTPGTFVALASNCSKAIYCNGVNSKEVDCDDQKPYFSAEDNSCVADSNKCGERPFGNKVTTNIPINTTPISTTIASTTKKSTTIPSTISTTSTTTHIPVTSSTSSTPTSLTTNPASSSLSCPLEDDPLKPLFLPHPKSCSQYYLCYHGVATIMNCPNMLHFDATLQSCNTADKVKCQISADISPRDQCLPQTVDVYPHPSNCNYYYLCEYGYLMVMQCPFNMGWDYEQRICVKKSKAKCYRDIELD